MTPKPSEAELRELERLEKAATPGPWRVLREHWRDGVAYCDGIEAHVHHEGMEPYVSTEAIVQTDSGIYPPTLEDADLIVAARNALPSLLAEIRRLRVALGEYK